MELSDILEVTDDLTKPRWVEYSAAPGGPGISEALQGFALLMRLPDVPGLKGLVLQASAANLPQLEGLADAEAVKKLEDFALESAGAVGLKLSHYAVLDWRGLTGAGLRHFARGAAVKVKAADETEIPFNRPLLQILLRWCRPFYDFVDRSWREMERGALEGQETEGKNSLDAPVITPTPPPVSAAGASKKRRSSAKSRPAAPAGGLSGVPPTT